MLPLVTTLSPPARSVIELPDRKYACPVELMALSTVRLWIVSPEERSFVDWFGQPDVETQLSNGNTRLIAVSVVVGAVFPNQLLPSDQAELTEEDAPVQMNVSPVW